jgi:hypothetical protein
LRIVQLDIKCAVVELNSSLHKYCPSAWLCTFGFCSWRMKGKIICLQFCSVIMNALNIFFSSTIRSNYFKW